MSEWLSWRCGISGMAAREQVRVARRLRDLPEVTAALLSGRISYSKARAITRVATEETEHLLVEWALESSAAHLEAIVSTYRRVLDLHEAENAVAQAEARSCSYFYDDYGFFVLNARLAPEDGAVVQKALELAGDRLFAARAEETAASGRAGAGDDDGRHPVTEAPNGAGTNSQAVSAETPSWTQHNADALVAAAESVLHHGVHECAGADRYQVVIHIDAESLAGGAGDTCELQDGRAIATDTARRVACDASLVGLVRGADGEVLNVGRKARAMPTALRRALRARDKTCRFPGCTRARFVDAHHIRYWTNGGVTSLDNLALLCRTHHRAVHGGGFRVKRCDGDLTFVDPSGRVLVEAPPLPPASPESLTAMNSSAGLEIDEQTCYPEWYGDVPDLSLSTHVLLQEDGLLR